MNQAISLLRQQCYIDGAWVSAGDGHTQAVYNPSTGELIGSVPRLSAQQVRGAIRAADAAGAAWATQTAKARATILRRWFDLCMEHQEALAQLLTLEQGKLLAEARGEIAYGSAFIEWFAEEAKRVYGDIIPSTGADRRIMVLKQPVGVVVAITLWNFPNAMITRKAGTALAAGCSIVIKPASATPFSALALAALAEQAGVPSGVLNIVTGKASEVGNELADNPTVRKLSFTGSTEVGKLLLERCAGTVKKVSMELGGNAPFIIFDDADLDAAVAGVMASKFRNAGQTCVCVNRVFVQAGIYEAFADKLKAAVEALQVGDGFEESVTLGPLIDEQAVAKVREHIEDALAGGAHLLSGGTPHPRGGNFLQPAILTDVSHDALLMREETFGPVAPLIRFDSEEEAIALANDTPFAAWPATSILATWRAPGVLPRPWSSASSA